MRNLIFLLCTLLLITGCSHQTLNKKLPLVEDKTKVFQIYNLTTQQKSLLMIQFNPNNWRFIQTNALGAPIARMVLTQQGWSNDGFVMPNKQAKLLFTALVTELFPKENFFNIKQKNGLFYWGKYTWRIQNKKNIDINFKTIHYQLSTMEF